MKKKNTITTITGIIFLTFGIWAIFNGIYILKNPSIILWICHIGLLLLGIGFLTKNKTLIQTQLNILTIPLIIWTIDFVYYLFTNQSLLDITGYFFQQEYLSSKIITSQHLFTIPLSLFSMRFIKKSAKNSIIISMIFITLIFLISRTLGAPDENINLVYSLLRLNGAYYSIIWFLVVSIMIIITNSTIKKLKF